MKRDRDRSLRSLFRRQGSNKQGDKAPAVAPHDVVMGFVSKRDWPGLRILLASKEGSSIASKCTEPIDDDGQHVLHVVSRSLPPLDVVKKLVQVIPGSVKRLNALDQTCLHLATAWGASPEVVKYLVKKYSAAASMQDVDGKTPLHMACEVCTWFGEGDVRAGQGALLEVVKTLSTASPKSVNLEDEEEMSPLEYAIFNGADAKIVKALQKASQWAWSSKREGKLMRRHSFGMASSDGGSRRFSNISSLSMGSRRSFMSSRRSFTGSTRRSSLVKANVGARRKSSVHANNVIRFSPEMVLQKKDLKEKRLKAFELLRRAEVIRRAKVFKNSGANEIRKILSSAKVVP